ncbi:MAG: ABC transporter permease [Bdellovibrionaceae bacterium]|nr:ABC transporter permease [Pseudobdellovibrionaceae bacterium]MCB9092891.1 ABC transporter permease [Halobacteriovoraceae bacterium]
MTYLSVRAVIYDETQGLRAIFSVVSAQIYFTGFQALPIISVLALASGSIVIMQSNLQLNFLGGNEMIGNLLVVIIVREISPLLTALVVIARSGTAVASELGNMRVNKEIEALESMSINPLSYIVFPRLFGGLISVICLAFYFTLVSLVGGFVVTKLVHDMPLNFYLDSLAQAFSGEDVILFLVKNTFSGVFIFIICCYQGFSVKRSPHEVPQVTTKAVMNSIFYVMGFNLTVTTLFYLNQLIRLGVL